MARVRHRQRRGMLKMYYGVGEEAGKSTTIDYCDINGAHFKPEEYLENLFKEKSLNELLDKETDIAKRKSANPLCYLHVYLMQCCYTFSCLCPAKISW